VRSEQDAGEDRSEIVLRRGPHHLAQRRRERARVDRDALPVARAQARVVLGRLQAQRRRVTTGRDLCLVAGDGDGDGARFEPAHDLAQQLRDHRNARFLDVGRDLHAVGDLEVGADELQALGRGRDAEVLQHRQGTAAARDGSLRGSDGIGQGVTLAAELHTALLLVFWVLRR
jgi:hypothetical protein